MKVAQREIESEREEEKVVSSDIQAQRKQTWRFVFCSYVRFPLHTGDIFFGLGVEEVYK